MLSLRNHIVDNPKSGGRDEEWNTALITLHASRAELASEKPEKLGADEAHFRFFAERVNTAAPSKPPTPSS